MSSSLEFLCLQWDFSSLRVLSVAKSGLKIIVLFSDVQRAHFPFIGEKGFAWFKIFQVISNFLFSFLSFHMCALSVVPLEFSCLRLWR